MRFNKADLAPAASKQAKREYNQGRTYGATHSIVKQRPTISLTGEKLCAVLRGIVKKMNLHGFVESWASLYTNTIQEG